MFFVRPPSSRSTFVARVPRVDGVRDEWRADALARRTAGARRAEVVWTRTVHEFFTNKRMQDSNSCIRGPTSYPKGIRGRFPPSHDLANNGYKDKRRARRPSTNNARILECQTHVRAFVVSHRTRRVFVDGFLPHVNLARHHCGDERRESNTVHEFSHEHLHCAQAQVYSNARLIFVNSWSYSWMVSFSHIDLASYACGDERRESNTVHEFSHEHLHCAQAQVYSNVRLIFVHS